MRQVFKDCLATAHPAKWHDGANGRVDGLNKEFSQRLLALNAAVPLRQVSSILGEVSRPYQVLFKFTDLLVSLHDSGVGIAAP